MSYNLAYMFRQLRRDMIVHYTYLGFMEEWQAEN